MTWDTWDQVYSLAFKHSSVSERGQALRKADDTFVMWYNSWFHECTWGKEPHGLIVRLRKAAHLKAPSIFSPVMTTGIVRTMELTMKQAFST